MDEAELVAVVFSLYAKNTASILEAVPDCALVLALSTLELYFRRSGRRSKLVLLQMETFGRLDIGIQADRAAI